MAMINSKLVLVACYVEGKEDRTLTRKGPETVPPRVRVLSYVLVTVR
jgi:hypothetical protein